MTNKDNTPAKADWNTEIEDSDNEQNLSVIIHNLQHHKVTDRNLHRTLKVMQKRKLGNIKTSPTPNLNMAKSKKKSESEELSPAHIVAQDMETDVSIQSEETTAANVRQLKEQILNLQQQLEKYKKK